MVLVDAYHEAFDTGLGAEQLRVFLRNRARQYHFLDAVARFGVARLLGKQMIELLGPDYRQMPLQERKRYVSLATRPKAMATTIDEHEQAVASLADPPSGHFQNNLPLRILTHGIPWPYQEYERIWQEAQHQAVTWSSRSKLIIAGKSGHAIMLAQPELVIAAIREVMEEASTGASGQG